MLLNQRRCRRQHTIVVAKPQHKLSYPRSTLTTVNLRFSPRTGGNKHRTQKYKTTRSLPPAKKPRKQHQRRNMENTHYSMHTPTIHEYTHPVRITPICLDLLDQIDRFLPPQRISSNKIICLLSPTAIKSPSAKTNACRTYHRQPLLPTTSTRPRLTARSSLNPPTPGAVRSTSVP